MNQDRDSLLAQWQEAKEQAANHTKLERELREKVVAAFFGDLPEGSATYELGNEFKLRATVQCTRKLENGNHETAQVYQKLPPAVAVELIRWKPELNKRAYDALDTEHKKLIDTVMTLKPSPAQLTLVTP